MRVYSPFFHTLHDEPGPVGRLGRGAHYSVLRAIVRPERKAYFHDFAIIWDEDHDDRVIWMAEQFLVTGLMDPLLMIGECKGTLTVLINEMAPQNYDAHVDAVAGSFPNDEFDLKVERLEDASRAIINDDPDRVRAYVHGIDALWRLGTKSCTFHGEIRPRGSDD